jgi:hypothetical protein
MPRSPKRPIEYTSEFSDVKHIKKRAFLQAFSKVGVVTESARIVGISRLIHNIWLKKDAEYAAAFQRAFEMAGDYLEAEAWRRATQGIDEPVFYQGAQCGVVRKYSDTLLIFMLKAARPNKYRENAAYEHKGEVKLIIEHIDTGKDSDKSDA